MKRVQLKKAALKFWRESGKSLLAMALVVFSLRSALADWNDVPTGSMKPTILEGDRVFVNKIAYDLKVPFTTWHIAEWCNPQRGDIVVFFSPADEQRLVKRVVGLPGDRIELVNNRLIVNGQPAKYEPLDPKICAEIAEIERPFHSFAKETVEDRSHAVMATPSFNAHRSFAPIIVPKGQYFMMGDNRDNSFDSRFFGCVDRRRIVGRATAVAISVDPEDFYLPRWHRFFTKLE